MRVQEAPQRYARALYEIAVDHKNVEQVLNEIREFNSALEKESDLHSFFMNRDVQSDVQKKALEGLFAKKSFSEEVRGLLTLLCEKRRFAFLPQIVGAFESVVDISQGVARGVVKSATTLFPDERAKLEQTISRYTGKKAVLEYQEEPGLLGGLVAQVGSFRFDDSLETQLRLMKDALKNRRAN